MKTKYTYGGLALTGILVFFLISVPAYSPLYVSNTDDLPMNVTVVTEHGQAGVANNQDSLRFGQVSTGVNVTKFVTVQNGEQAAKLHAQSSSGIAPFVSVTPEKQVLEPRESANLTVTLRAREPGSFTGTLTLQQVTARFAPLSFLVRFL